MAFRPDPSQTTLTIDPATRMDAIRSVQLRSVEMRRSFDRQGRLKIEMGTTAHKHLLLLLDHRIGKGSSWEMTYEEIAQALELKLNSVYRLASDLDRLCLIRRASRANGRVAFSICWSNLFDLLREQRERPANSGTEDANSGTGVGNSATEAPNSATGVGDSGSGVAPLIPPNTPPPPPPPRDAAVMVAVEELIKESPQDAHPDEEGPEVDQAIIAVQSCGATDAGPAVAFAMAHGWSAQRIVETVEYFASMRPAWDAGALVKRLKRLGSHLHPIEDGWPPRNKSSASSTAHSPAERSPYVTPDERAAAAANLEAMHGEALDAMTPEQLNELVFSSARVTSPRERRDALTIGRDDRELRAKLLRTLDDRALNKGQPRGKPPPTASSSGPFVESAAP